MILQNAGCFIDKLRRMYKRHKLGRRMYKERGASAPRGQSEAAPPLTSSLNIMRRACPGAARFAPPSRGLARTSARRQAAAPAPLADARALRRRLASSKACALRAERCSATGTARTLCALRGGWRRRRSTTPQRRPPPACRPWWAAQTRRGVAPPAPTRRRPCPGCRRCYRRRPAPAARRPSRCFLQMQKIKFRSWKTHNP